MTHKEYLAALPCHEWLDDNQLLWPSLESEPTGRVGWFMWGMNTCYYHPPDKPEREVTLKQMKRLVKKTKRDMLVRRLTGHHGT